MYIKNALAIVGLLFSTLAISQEVIPQTSPNAITRQITMSKITKISENKLSASLTAHTYKLVSGELSEMTDLNSNQLSNSSSIEGMINAFLDVEGVSRCTFDHATQTFTVLSKPTTSLTQAFRSINNND